MNRRRFIKYSSLSLVPFPALATTSNSQLLRLDEIRATATYPTIHEIEHSIKIGFGSGFSLDEVKLKGNQVLCLIEHEQNVYLVSSSDLVDWKILQANEM